MRKAAPLTGAALVLCVGLLWPAPLSFAASETEGNLVSQKTETVAVSEPEAVESPTSAPSTDDANNVVVEAPSVDPTPTPVPSEPVAPPATEPTTPAYENAWPIGLDDASAVVAELWDDGTFVVDGAGDTAAFESAEEVPWLAADVADDIKRVVFADAVEPTSLAHWFEGCTNLEEVANVPASAKDLTRLFFECPKLVELPDDLAFSDNAETAEMFGFEQAPTDLVETIYRGTDENVLAYDWAGDARALVNPDAPVIDPDPIPDVEAPDAPEGEAIPDPDASEPSEETTPNDEPITSDDEEPSSDTDAQADPVPDTEADSSAPEEAPASTTASASEENPADVQVNITIPSSVTMSLGAEGTNEALIPVMVANRSERDVAIVGARLKRADMDLPGGSWSLTTESGRTVFVTDARFTPLGLEVPFDMPIILQAGGDTMMLAWHSEFSDYGMKTLLNAVADAGDTGFTYGSMIWIVSAA